jgi:predicted transcriptional regulator
MMPQKIRIMDEEDLELVGVLISLGVRRNLAAAIVYLCRNREATSRQIEVATNLSQPEICLAMRAMRENDWTEERNIKAPGTGRPQKSYMLRASLVEILAYYEEKVQDEAARARDLVQRLKELAAVVQPSCA